MSDSNESKEREIARMFHEAFGVSPDDPLTASAAGILSEVAACLRVDRRTCQAVEAFMAELFVIASDEKLPQKTLTAWATVKLIESMIVSFDIDRETTLAVLDLLGDCAQGLRASGGFERRVTTVDARGKATA